MTRVLIIDDEDLFRDDLAALLRQGGYDCETAASGESGLEMAERFRPDIVLCDLVMPGIGGVEVTGKLTESQPECAVLVVSAHATVDTAIAAFRRGAIDVILKPIVTEALLNRLRRMESERRLRADVQILRRELARCGAEDELLGTSRAIQDVRGLIKQVAAHDTVVLVTGESGTGKEVVARSIHLASGRRGPFIAVNCVAVTASLFESELFGHAKGAFTGAEKARQGFFEAARGGTLLLDEVGEIPLELQGKLLRAVERREITRVGEVVPVPLDVRIIAATNRDLGQMVQEDRFRTDLYYRLRVLHIRMPPLREQPEDIRDLSHHFLQQLASRMHVHRTEIRDDAMDALMRYGWPGNVRELRNTIERALIVGAGDTVRLSDLPSEIRDTRACASDNASVTEDLKAAMRYAERAHILRILQRSNGNKGEAAQRLGIDPSTLWRKLESDEIP